MNYTFILPVIVIFTTIILGGIVLVDDHGDIRNKTMFALIVLSASWITGSFLADNSTQYISALFWTRVAIIPPAFVLPLFLYFSTIFPAPIKKGNWKSITLIFSPAIFYLFLFATRFNVETVSIQNWGVSYTPGVLYKLFIPYFVIFFSITLFNLMKSYKIGDRISRAQIIFVLLGMMSAFVIGLITNVVFPLLGESKVAVFGPSIAILSLVSFSTYAILKHHLFNIKVIAAELLTIAIWIFLLIQILVSATPQAKLVNGVLLLFIVFFGVLLMRSVINEVSQRERLQALTAQLEEANEKLKKLDKLKTEFLGLASHQVRSPLSVIKGSASMLLDGSYGILNNDQQRNQIEQIFKSSNNLSKLIEDLLNVTKIEQGGMKYEMQQIDLKQILQEIVQELTPLAKKKNLKLLFVELDIGSHIAQADSLKIRQAFLNVIDNAIKYTQTGTIQVSVGRAESGKVKVSISDTGTEMSKSDISVLFEKFSRRDNLMSNSGGSGLGLYLAKKIINDHNGRIWAESPGIGKGSSFIIEF